MDWSMDKEAEFKRLQQERMAHQEAVGRRKWDAQAWSILLGGVGRIRYGEAAQKLAERGYHIAKK